MDSVSVPIYFTPDNVVAQGEKAKSSSNLRNHGNRL